MKVLLDTSLLLPTLGIDVGNADKILKKLRNCLLYSIALNNNMKFASLDKELRKFVRDHNLRYVFFE